MKWGEFDRLISLAESRGRSSHWLAAIVLGPPHGDGWQIRRKGSAAMARKKTTTAKPSRHGGPLERTPVVSWAQRDAAEPSTNAVPTNGDAKLPDFCPSLACGAPYAIDDFDDPHNTGVFGKLEPTAPWAPLDDEGLTTITPFLKEQYDWQIYCWDRECRQILAKYGCVDHPAAPLPSPPPDDATELENDAFGLVCAIRGLKKRFRVGDAFGAMMWATSIGRIVQRMRSRWADTLVDRGRKHHAGGRRGGDHRRAAERDKWESWRREASEFRLKYPQIKSKREIAKLIHNRHASPGDPLAGTIEAIRKKI